MLCLLNLYDYAGLVPLLPETWLLPRSLPLHPGRMWCLSRQVYLPMAIVISVALAASLLVSFSVIPALTPRLMRQQLGLSS